MAQITQTSQIHWLGKPSWKYIQAVFLGQLFKSMVVYIQMMSLTYEEMLDLSEEKLEKMGVTKVNYHLSSIDPKMI